MAWVNIGDVRFRDVLPNSGKVRCEMEMQNDEREVIHNQLLLKDNIPMRYRWTKAIDGDDDDACEKGRRDLTAKKDDFWMRKETSCDIEVDTIGTVILTTNTKFECFSKCILMIVLRSTQNAASNILNVNDIMTRLPSQSEEEIHWRAVPSLREIWAEERQRMATLLPPKENFLSGENGSPSFTLSVKKGAPVPDYILAAKGNLRLFDSSPTLHGDFRKAMIDIIHKHESSVKVMDEMLTIRDERVKNTAFGKRESDAKQEQNLSCYLSPKDDAFLALEGLLNQFPSTCPSPMSPKDGIVCRYGNMMLTPSKSYRLSQMQQHVPSMTQADIDEVNENLEFCRDADFGNLALKDDIDPSTLTQYIEAETGSVLDEEDLMEEEEFEKTLTILGTQKVQSSSESLSQLDSVVNSWTGSQSKSELEVFPFAQESISSEEVVQSLSPNIVGNPHSTPKERPKPQISLLSSESPSICLKKGDTLELKAYPPPMSHFHKSSPIRLHPSNNNENIPVPWLGYYSSSTLNEATALFYGKSWQGIFVEPVVGPPSARRVRKWVLRKRKSCQSSKTKPSSTNKREKKHPNGKDALEFDANTRKLLRVRSNKKRRVAFAEDPQFISSATVGLIEEVNWAEGSEELTQDSIDTTPSKSDKSEKVADSPQVEISNRKNNAKYSEVTQITALTLHSDSPQKTDPLRGIGNQGGRIYIEGGGLKASTATTKVKQKQLSMMSIEVHVQCRTGKAGINNSTEIAMKPDPTRDSIFAVCYVYAFDPGGGEQIKVVERGCVFVPTENEMTSFRNTANGENVKHIIPKVGKTMGVSSRLKIEAVPDERKLLLRISSIVQWKDPDALFSWDTQSLGLGYLIERGLALGRHENNEDKKRSKIDMVRLLGRTPKRKPCSNDDIIIAESEDQKAKQQWSGSGLGTEWDDRVGAGAGPSSIVSHFVWFNMLNPSIV